MEHKIKIKQVVIDITTINPRSPMNLASAWHIMDIIRDRVAPHPACNFFVMEPRNISDACYDATANIVRLYTPRDYANRINEDEDNFIFCVADFMSNLVYSVRAEIPKINFNIIVRVDGMKLTSGITELFYDSKDEDAFMIHGGEK